MFKKNKTIEFQPSSEKIELLVEPPSPAYKHVPDWYKNQQLFSGNESNYLKAFKKPNFAKTYKMCTPLVDSLTSGYIVKLPADIIVTNNSSFNYEPKIHWSVSWEMLDSQPQEVLGNYPIPEGYAPFLFRWNPSWIIKTPNKYSLWITHPSHRHDLPFFTLSAFVDTDKHPNGILFPFFIKNNFEGIIEKDTPIAQIIPIKRDHWITKINKFNINNWLSNPDNVLLKMTRVYKHNYWSRKNYE
jgi:hypothetical protein